MRKFCEKPDVCEGLYELWTFSQIQWFQWKPWLMFSCPRFLVRLLHYCDVIMGAMPSQISSFTIVYSIVYSVVDQRKHQSSASLAFVWGIHRWLVNSPHKGPVTQKMFPFDDVIMQWFQWKPWLMFSCPRFFIILLTHCIAQLWGNVFQQDI